VAEGAVAIMPGEEHASFGDVGDNWNGLTLDCIDGALCWLTWTTTNGEVSITDCNQAASGELVIPDTIEGNPVTSIGVGAFRSCTSLTSITIPDSVTSIGERAFERCTSLTTIEVGAGNVNYTDVNGVLFNTEKTLLLAYPAGKTDTNYNIPDSVTSIGVAAFFNCSSLASITIPDSVTSIGQGAFYQCSSLSIIIFLGAPPTVGANAFTGVAHGAVALVTRVALSSFGNFGTWNGLTVGMSHSDLNDLLAQSPELSQRPTQAAYDAAVATARTAGQGDVTGAS
jgi:hypothetical protein